MVVRDTGKMGKPSSESADRDKGRCVRERSGIGWDDVGEAEVRGYRRQVRWVMQQVKREGTTIDDDR